MKRTSLALLFLAGAGFGTYTYLARDSDTVPAAPSGMPTGGLPAPVRESGQARAMLSRWLGLSQNERLREYMASINPYGEGHALSDVERDFYTMTRVKDFIGKYLERARMGDGESQYHVGFALTFCMGVPSAEAIREQLGDRQGDSREFMRRSLEDHRYRCEGIVRDDARLYRGYLGWLTRAAGKGYGPAQLDWTSMLVQFLPRADFPIAGAKLDLLRQASRDYLQQAVMSRHPQVLSSVAMAVFDGHDKDENGNGVHLDAVEGMAWGLLAERAGAKAALLRQQLEPRGLSDGQREAAERRSRELADLLARGEWDALRTPVLYRSFGLPEFDQPISADLHIQYEAQLDKIGQQAFDGFAVAGSEG